MAIPKVKGKGVHERLTNIMHAVTDVDFEREFDGQWFLSAKDRQRVRDIAAGLVALMDEYDELDPI